jgi:uncharacterized protein
MDETIIKKVEKIVIAASQNKKNRFSYNAWENHIKIVYDLSLLLAKKLGADGEIVAIAALLHDIASLKNKKYVKEHHVHGLWIARQILEKLNYPEDRLMKVLHCIYAHRGSKKIPRETLEAKIVASADAMSHIVYFPSILRLAIIPYQMPLNEAVPWSLAKIKRSWNKIELPAGKKMVKPHYEAICLICNYIVKNKTPES